MRKFSNVLREKEEENRRRIEKLYRLSPIWPFTESIERSIPQETTASFWYDHEINMTICSLTKKAALIFLDEVLWSKGIDSSDPFQRDSSIIVRTNGLERYEEDLPTLRINILIEEGDGCYRVQISTEETPVYEWRCK